MAQTFDLDFRGKLSAGLESLAEIPSVIDKGMDAALEMSQATGSDKLKASSERMAEAAKALNDVFKELHETGVTLDSYYKRIDETLN